MSDQQWLQCALTLSFLPFQKRLEGKSLSVFKIFLTSQLNVFQLYQLFCRQTKNDELLASPFAMCFRCFRENK